MLLKTCENTCFSGSAHFPGHGKKAAKKRIDETERYEYNMFRVSNLDRRNAVHRGEGERMEIRVGENESLESALKRWKRKCARSGVLAEVRKREHYEKPSVKRKKKAEAARKRKY